MNRYVVHRLLLAIPTLVGVTFLVFLAVRLQPGTAAAIACGSGCTKAQQSQVEHAFGLDRPIPSQYLQWLGGVLRGDFGRSYLEHISVGEQLRTKIPISIELGLLGMIVALVIAVPVGILSAARQDTVLDYSARTVSVLLIAVPAFWVAVLLISLGAKYRFWTPQLNYTSLAKDPLRNIKIVWIPAILLGASVTGALMRLTRAQLLEVLREDYIRTAWSKGLRERVVLRRHAARNAFLPIVTLVGLQVPTLLGGTVILETIFSIPGMGRYLIDAIRRSDLPVIQAVNLIIAFTVIASNLAVDLMYVVIDPRVKYGG